MVVFLLCYEIIKSWWVFSFSKSMKYQCELGLLKSRSEDLCCGQGLEPWGQQFLVACVSALTRYICLVWSHFDLKKNLSVTSWKVLVAVSCKLY